MKVYARFKWFFILVLASLSACCLFNAGNIFVHADSQPLSAGLYSPLSAMEYCELTAPLDATFFGDNVVIVSENNNMTLYYNGKYKNINEGFLSLKQAKYFYGNNLLISDNGSIFKFDFTAQSPVKEQTYDTSNAVIGGNNFDVNEDYLITAYGKYIHVYSVNSDGALVKQAKVLDGNADYPVLINRLNQVFYVYEDQIYGYSLSNPDQEPAVLSSDKPIAMTANEEFLYYSCDGKIYSVNLLTKEKKELSVSSKDANSHYDLGKLSSPRGMCLKNGNLMITDKTIGAVQEFEIDYENGLLSFTGFAIAKNKTAFNRLHSSVSKIEKYSFYTVALDQNKFTIITDIEGVKTYKNIARESVLTTGISENFAVGDRTTLVYNGQSFLLFDLIDKEEDLLNKSVLIDGTYQNVSDVYYQGGYYYFSTIIERTVDDGVNETITYYDCNIYSVNEKTLQVKNVIQDQNVGQSLIISVDLFSNVYTVNENGAVKGYFFNGTGYDVKSFSITIQNAKNAVTDLLGNLFVLTDNKLATLTEAGLSTTDLTSEFDGDFTYLATDSLDGKLLLVKKDHEIILQIDYDKFICQKRYEKNLLFTPSLSAYSSNKALLDLPNKSFVATSVDLYFLPLISDLHDFAIHQNDVKIRLSAKTEIYPEQKLFYSNQLFYLAKVIVGDSQLTGYIPVDFTTTMLSEDFIPDSFSMIKLNETLVYSNSNLTTVLTNVPSNTQAKLYGSENGVSKIAILLEDEWVDCFVAEANIQSVPNVVIRNVLVLICATLSLAVTSLYFLFRKKRA